MRKRCPEVRTCVGCGKEYTITRNYGRNVKFCSNDCGVRYSFSGERQWRWSGGPIMFTCSVCGKETTKRRGNSGGNLPKFCSRDCSKIGRVTKIKSACPGCGKVLMVSPSWIKRGRQYCTISCYRHNRVKPNTIERAIQDGLVSRGVEFIAEYPVFRYHIDIYVPCGNIAVECDGDYWHKGKEISDGQRTEKLEKAGFTVIRLMEKDIRNSPEECIERIISAIPNHQ